jgi:hypothetical protein
MRPSCFQVRQNVIPLPARVSLLHGFVCHKVKPTSKQSPTRLLVARVARLLSLIFMPRDAPEAHDRLLQKADILICYQQCPFSNLVLVTRRVA